MRENRWKWRAFWAGAVLLLAGGTGEAEKFESYVDYDLLRRARVIVIVGAAEGATGPAAERATETARVIARRLAEMGRVQPVSSERVTAAMTKLKLGTPRDFFKREPRIGLKLDLDQAATLANRCGADATLIPIWDTPPPDPKAPGVSPLRLHVLLVHRVRKLIIWEDVEVLPGTTATPQPEITPAMAEAAVGPLADRFTAAWRLAGERG